MANNADIIAEVPATGLRLLDGPVLTAYGFDTNDTLAWKPNPIHVPSTIGSESDCATVVEADSDFAAESCQSRVDGEGRRIISVTSASLTASDVGGSSRRLSPTSNGTATASNRDGYRSDPAQHVSALLPPPVRKFCQMHGGCGALGLFGVIRSSDRLLTRLRPP